MTEKALQNANASSKRLPLMFCRDYEVEARFGQDFEF